MKLTTGIASAVLLATALPVLGAGPAQAGDDVVNRGSCSGSAHWKMKAKPDDGRIEVESEIDSDRNGQTWRWVLKHNGTASARGTATTHAPSGSFDIERRLVDANGQDSFRFRAVNNASGEVCVATVVL
jgi:hypothetical protein